MTTITKRKPDSPYVKSVRPMTRDDLQFLREKSSRPPLVQKLRDSHHKIARLIASGMSTNDIAEALGYTPTRIATLKNSPAMQELVSRYRADEDQSWRQARDEYYASVHAAGAKAWRLINEQLDEQEESGAEPLPVNKLLAIADSSADRVGYHRKSTKENINIDFAARLEKAITRTKTIEGKALEE